MEKNQSSSVVDMRIVETEAAMERLRRADANREREGGCRLI